MKLKKRTKRFLKNIMIGFAIFAMVLPLFSYYLPQNQSSATMDPRLMEEMLKAQDSIDEIESEVPGDNVEGAYQVIEATSGDTLSILWGDVQENVKLIGVAPVEESREELQKLLEGEIVNLEFDVVDQDKKGNLLAYAYREDGIFINREMLSMGYAKLKDEPDNRKYIVELQEAEESAHAKSLGCWAQKSEEKHDR